MKDTRWKDVQWIVCNDEGHVTQWDQVQVAVLMDLRDELKRLNALLHCDNFIDIPATLTRIARHTTKATRKKARTQ